MWLALLPPLEDGSRDLDSPDTGVTTSDAYDSAGRLLRERRNDGKVITYGWDGLGRPRWRQNGDTTEEYRYDDYMRRRLCL